MLNEVNDKNQEYGYTEILQYCFMIDGTPIKSILSIH
jgi:hypothetical protein